MERRDGGKKEGPRIEVDDGAARMREKRHGDGPRWQRLWVVGNVTPGTRRMNSTEGGRREDEDLGEKIAGALKLENNFHGQTAQERVELGRVG